MTSPGHSELTLFLTFTSYHFWSPVFLSGVTNVNMLLYQPNISGLQLHFLWLYYWFLYSWSVQTFFIMQDNAGIAWLSGVYVPFPHAAPISWWRHQMETFSALLALCAGNSLVTGESHSQRPVTWSFDVFFDLHLNKHLSKHFVRLVIWDAIVLIMTSL